MDPSQIRPQTRPRAKSGFSFTKSNKPPSVGSSPQKPHKRQESLQETAAEKRKIHMSETTKANPNAAIQEAQPSAAALEQSTLQTMNNIRFTDIYGRAIEGEPDKSNPTRSRHERPLDTIRGFEYAIDKAYAQRQSAYYQGGASDTSAVQSRRSSAYWAGNNNNSNGTYDQAGRSSYSLAAPGYGGPSRDSYGENGYGHPPPRFNQRMQSDPSPNRYAGGQGAGRQGAGLYPAVGNSQSRDTLNTNGASSGSEQWKDSTVPTSEESSLDRANGVVRANGGYQEGYGPQYSDDERGPPRNGYGPRTPQYSSPNGGGYYPQNQQGGPRGPPVPSKFGGGGAPPPPSQKNVISLGAPSNVPSGAVQPARSQQRSSWLKKRFSRGK